MLVVCDYLNGVVEMPDERSYEICFRWPQPRCHADVIDTIVDPDEVRIDSQVVYGDGHVLIGKIYLFCRWFDEINDGSHVVAAICEGGLHEYRYINSFHTKELTTGERRWSR